VTRSRVSLDGTWELFPDPANTLTRSTLGSTAPPRAIRVPGPWQAQFEDLRDYSGVAWYRRTLTVPPDDPPDRVTILHFGAVDYHTTVWLNGREVGTHEGGYLPFEFDITALVRPGETDDLVVRVLDPGNDADSAADFPFDEIPHGKQSWYGPIGGIWQSVWVERRAPLHISRIKVTPNVPEARVRVELRLSRPASGERVVNLTIRDPRGGAAEHRRVVGEGRDAAAFDLPVPDPMLWDTVTPNLYTVDVQLHDHGQVDRLDARFGMRTIGTSSSGQLLLNGQELYLRGALDQD
jgi:beta-galactosidase/beta-glucuronidase